MDRWGRLKPCVMAIWPGLPRLWREGSVLGLIQALGFALLLQLAVFTTLIWSETIRPVSRGVVCFCVLGFWLLFALPAVSRALAVFGGGFAVHDREHLFQVAQREYLRGNWLQAERSLRQLLESDAGDVDARLMLSTLYRHVGRLSAASEQLGVLAESHGSDKWKFEMFTERLSLARLHRSSRDTSDGDSDKLATEAA